MTATMPDARCSLEGGLAPYSEFAPEAADVIVAWLSDSPECLGWLAGGGASAVDELRRWHGDGDVRPFVLTEAVPAKYAWRVWLPEPAEVRIVGYGELSVEMTGRRAELAHLIVDPSHRGLGYGRSLATQLVDIARGMELEVAPISFGRHDDRGASRPNRQGRVLPRPESVDQGA